jgi:hypothetical protein
MRNGSKILQHLIDKPVSPMKLHLIPVSGEFAMKKKLCPIDKTGCIGESCMAFCEETGRCGLVRCEPPHEKVVGEAARKSDHQARENSIHEKKSRFKAELFD